jgi:SHS2 domain-containing protein
VGDFHYLEDIALADAAFEATAKDRADLFATCARALTDIMIEPGVLGTSVERLVELEAETLEALLYAWLAEIVFLKDSEGILFGAFDLELEGSGPFRLTGRLRGEPIEKLRSGLRSDAKAVTYHRFAVGDEDGIWKATVVIDL